MSPPSQPTPIPPLEVVTVRRVALPGCTETSHWPSILYMLVYMF